MGGSRKDSQRYNWKKTLFRWYLKGLSYRAHILRIKEKDFYTKVNDMIPDWKNEFIEVGKFPVTDNALWQRGDKAIRLSEYPKKEDAKEAWDHAIRDFDAGLCTFERNEKTATYFPTTTISVPTVIPELKKEELLSKFEWFYLWGNGQFTSFGITNEENPYKRIKAHAKGAHNEFRQLTIYRIYKGTAKDLENLVKKSFENFLKKGDSIEVLKGGIEAYLGLIPDLASDREIHIVSLSEQEIEKFKRSC